MKIPSVLDVEALGFADGAASGCRGACGGFFCVEPGARLGNLRDDEPAALEADDPIATVCAGWRVAVVGWSGIEASLELVSFAVQSRIT